MSNYFRYGSYQFPAGAANVAINHTTKFNDAMNPLAIVATWSIDAMVLLAANTTLEAQLNALEAAFARHGQNASFFHHTLTNNQTLGGVRVTVPPSYGNSRGAELVNYRTVHIELEAELPFSGTSNSLVSFDEEVTYDAGPEYGYIPVLNGPAVRQRVCSKPLHTATQRGSAIGYGNAPSVEAIAPPLFPSYLIKRPAITRGTPKRIGNAYTEFPVTWEYTFQSPSALSKAPNRWRGR